jgi:hypothetical protein
MTASVPLAERDSAYADKYGDVLMKKKAKTSKHKAANDNKAKRLNIMRVPVTLFS